MSTAREPDLAVIGAGPGGAAAALAAARLGLEVVLFDPQRGELDKPCGEGLLPLGVDALRALGIEGLEEEAAPFAGMRYRMPGAKALDVPFERAGLALPRTTLQRRLQEAVAAEPRIRRIYERATTEPSAGSRASVRSKSREWRVAAVAVADGAHGTSATWLEREARRPRSTRLGLRARYRATRPLTSCEVHLGLGPDVYLTPLPGDVVNVAVLVDDPPEGVTSRELVDRATALYPEAREQLGELVTPPASRRLGMTPRRRAAQGRAFVVGDSGGSVDPILGCGTSVALATGLRAATAAHALVQGVDSARVEHEYARAYRREIAGRRRAAALLQLASRHRLVARATLALGRRVPFWTRIMVDVATGSAESASSLLPIARAS